MNAQSKENLQSIYPLLPMHEGMLFESLYNPSTWTYFEQLSFRITGLFDPELCRQTWNCLVQRHEMLRSSFAHQPSTQALHMVWKTRDVEFHLSDLSGLTEPEQSAQISLHKTRDRDRGFNLHKDPLVRVAVFELCHGRWEMIWSYPHILLDGWSIGILLSEFQTIYQSLRKGAPVALPEPALYSDYLDWLERRDRQAAREFWREQLAGYESLASVPDMGMEKHGPGYVSRVHSFRFDAGQSADLTALAARHDVSLNTLFQCLWGILLAFYNDTDDVVFGTVVSGRPAEIDGMESLVGLLIRTVPVRLQWTEGHSFVELLQQAHSASLSRLTHEFLSLSEIQSHSPLRQGLLDHLLVFENYPLDAARLSEADWNALGFRVEETETFEQAHYDFGILIQPGSAIEIKFPYNANCYSLDQMRRMEIHLRVLAASVLQNPDASISKLEILSGDERNLILEEFCSPGQIAPGALTIVSAWEEQSTLTPDRCAVVYESTILTYRQLNERANQVAHALFECGMAPEERIGVFMNRGDWLIACLLGILKSGGTYLPIDPSYPEERIRYILQDSGCRFVLSDPSNRTRAESLVAGRVLDGSSLTQGGADNPLLQVAPSSLAYVIYTSGSTGAPKGVMIEHHGFMNMIRQQITGFGLTPRDQVLQFASNAFDASLSEIFMALLCGATLVMISEEVIKDIERFGRCMDEQGITVVTLPPSYLRALDHRDFSALRVLLTAGEPAVVEDARFYASRLRYFNAYGPTETSVCATFHRVLPDAPPMMRVPIGAPLANTRARVLNRRLQPLPVGVPGELYIAGEGLARGYLNRPDLTGERFISSPFDGDGRLYKTGDWVRWLPDGTLDFLGRRDEQFKLNGYRIELGEVESRLLQCPGVQQAAAQMWASEEGSRQLVAYVVTSKPIDVSTMQGRLRSTLPDYMVPSQIIQLESLPLTPNLKVDKKALPPPPCAVSENTYAEPRTEPEIKLAAVWREVLKAERIGIYDSYLALGGDSIKAIQIAGRLSKMGLRLILRDLYERKTIAAIAPRLSNLHSDNSHVSGRAPLSPIQRWFFREHSSGLHHLNHIVLLQAHEPLNLESAQAALVALLNQHDMLRARFYGSVSSLEQEIPPASDDVLLIERDLRGGEDEKGAMQEHIRSLQDGFDLSRGPLCKSVLYRLTGNDYWLLMIHHLVVDAFSWRILLDDLTAAYESIRQKRAIVLPPKSSSYLQWCHTLQTQSVRASMLAEIPYWSAVEGAQTTSIPLDYPARIIRYGETDNLSFVIPSQDLYPALEWIKETHGLALQALLLTALARALRSWHGGCCTRILLSSHGRHEMNPSIHVHRTVGWFTALYPFLLEAPQSECLQEQIMETATALDRVPGQGLGYGILRYLTPRELTTEIPFAERHELHFNFLGEFSGGEVGDRFTISDLFSNSSISPELECGFPLQIESVQWNGLLEMQIRYSSILHRKATIQSFADALKHETQMYLYLLVNNYGMKQ